MADNLEEEKNQENEDFIPKERVGCIRWTSVLLPMIYSFVGLICTCIILGLYNEKYDPRVEEIQELIIEVGRNVNSTLIWNFNAVNFNQNCSRNNNASNGTFYEEIPVAEFPLVKSGCICSDDFTKLAVNERCQSQTDPNCKSFDADLNWNPEPAWAYEFTGGWKLCAARYNMSRQPFENDKCGEGEYQYGI